MEGERERERNRGSEVRSQNSICMWNWRRWMGRGGNGVGASKANSGADRWAQISRIDPSVYQTREWPTFPTACRIDLVWFQRQLMFIQETSMIEIFPQAKYFKEIRFKNFLGDIPSAHFLLRFCFPTMRGKFLHLADQSWAWEKNLRSGWKTNGTFHRNPEASRV